MKARMGLLILGCIFLAVAATARQEDSEEVSLAWTGETWTSLPIKVAVDKGFFDRTPPFYGGGHSLRSAGAETEHFNSRKFFKAGATSCGAFLSRL